MMLMVGNRRSDGSDSGHSSSGHHQPPPSSWAMTAAKASPSLPQTKSCALGGTSVFPSRSPLTPTLTPPATMLATASMSSPSSVAHAPTRKRKIIVDSAPSPAMRHKRHNRSWTEMEYEEMLEEATLLCEELELLVAVATDLCRDLATDPTQVRSFAATLEQIDALMASTSDLTEHQVREMCRQMIGMMQYLCQRHYAHFALIDMQDQLRESRDRFMRFICKHENMIGLPR